MSKQSIDLSPEQVSHLVMRFGERTGAKSGARRIPRRRNFNHLPLSFAQERLWIINQLELENFKSIKSDAVKVGKLALGALSAQREIMSFDLMMYLLETREGLEGTLLYKTDCFSQKTIDIMVSRFVTILDHVAADPNIRLLDISLDGGKNQAWSVDQVDEDESFNF